MRKPHQPIWESPHGQGQSNTAVRERNKRAFLWAVQRGLCAACGAKRAAETFEHVKPKRLGGTNARENLILTCRPCNEERADREELLNARSYAVHKLVKAWVSLDMAFKLAPPGLSR